MNGKILKKFILSAVLISTFFTAFLFVPISMPILEMGAMDSQMNHHSSHNTGDNHSAMPCCDMIGASCVLTTFITSQFSGIAVCGENKRVASSNLAIHFIIIQNTTPPPKA